MKRMILAAALAGAILVAYGSMKKNDQQVKAEKKGQSSCIIKKGCMK